MLFRSQDALLHALAGIVQHHEVGRAVELVPIERHPGLEGYFGAKWNLVTRTADRGVFLGTSVERFALRFGRPLTGTTVVPTVNWTVARPFASVVPAVAEKAPPPRTEILLEQIRDAIRRAEDRLGGAGRVLVRPSGTEPALRVMVEGPDDELVTELADSLAALAGERLN